MALSADRVDFLNVNVYEAAKLRIRWAINNYDRIVVAFSGGKDSLAMLYLVEEVYAEMGITRPVDAFFLDEELIWDEVIDFVAMLRAKPQYAIKWICVPLKSQRVILGELRRYIQWDKNRPWIRPKPEYAITEIPGDPEGVWSQYEIPRFVKTLYRGKVAVMVGIRAEESLIRRGAIMNNRRGISFVHNEQDVPSIKPVYDWREEDIFKLFYDLKKPYCEIYDSLMWGGARFRVATVINSESSKQMERMMNLNPVFWQQVINIFPESEVQARYANDIDFDALIEKYPRSFDGMRKFANERLSDLEMRGMALRVIDDCERTRRRNIINSKFMPFGGFSLRYVWGAIAGGGFKRGAIPMMPDYGEADYEYEGKNP